MLTLHLPTSLRPPIVERFPRRLWPIAPRRHLLLCRQQERYYGYFRSSGIGSDDIRRRALASVLTEMAPLMCAAREPVTTLSSSTSTHAAPVCGSEAIHVARFEHNGRGRRPSRQVELYSRDKLRVAPLQRKIGQECIQNRVGSRYAFSAEISANRLSVGHHRAVRIGRRLARACISKVGEPSLSLRQPVTQATSTRANSSRERRLWRARMCPNWRCRRLSGHSAGRDHSPTNSVRTSRYTPRRSLNQAQDCP